MKKINLLYILIMFIAFASCNDDYVAPNSFSDVSWYSPTFKGNDFDRYPIIGQRNYFSIADISQGEKSHKWELLNDSIFFLQGPIERRDTTLAEKINGGGNLGDVSTDKTVHLYFPKGGIQSVRLYNTFEKEVNFRAKDTTLTSVFDEKLGLHVFEHIFTVDVYHDVVADYKVYRENGDLIDFTAADTIRLDIANGEKLSFVQNVDSIYHITGVNWAFPKAVPATSFADSVSVTFYNPGEIKNISLTASRSGNNIPAGSDKVILPLVLNVADGPFKPVEITKGSSTSIKVQLSGALDGNLAPSDFTVVAKNADLGQDFNLAISSISMENDNTLAVLKLGEPIYSNDEVHVSYVGTGHQSTDGRPLEQETLIIDPITELSVVDQDFFGFEKETSAWVNSGGAGLHDFVANPAGEAGNSAQISVKKGGATVFLDSPSLVPLQEGTTYKITYKLYLDSRVGLNNGFNLRLAPDGAAFDDANALVSGWMAYGNTNHFKEGEWVTHSYTKVAKSTDNYWLHVRVGQGNLDDYGVFYIDDINVEVVDVRPAP